jgi:hypothetical protein
MPATKLLQTIKFVIKRCNHFRAGAGQVP